jgi:hypothetical protein
MSMTRRQFVTVATTAVLLQSWRTQGLKAMARPRLVLVHGRGQQGLNAATLKQEWLTALERGARAIGMPVPPDVDVAVPYYADVMEQFTLESRIPLASTMRARGTAVDDEYLVFQADVAESIRRQIGITDAQVDAEYGPDPTPRGPLNWKWVQATLRVIDQYGYGLNQTVLETFTRDVFLYTTRPGVQQAIDKIVAAKITDQPTIVVAHSLGSVVAYNVLLKDPRTLTVPLYLTVGSPLAVRAVRDQFRPLKAPVPVAKWYNAMDTRDVVALYPLDADNFPISPAIENNITVQNHTDDRHGIDGYLDDQNVARRILQALNS